MTAADQPLDSSLIVNALPLYLYRLTLEKYADLSGAGAALAAGRWNLPGEEALYTSLDPATTILERLAHTPKDKIPTGLVLMKIRVTGDWRQRSSALIDERTAGVFRLTTSLASAKEMMSAPSDYNFALAVPSVIAPSWNIVLYRKRIAFWKHVTLESVDPFDFDSRLFPEDAIFET